MRGLVPAGMIRSMDTRRLEGTAVLQGTEPRQLTTVLFVDIVDATPLAVDLGDAAWARLLERYHGIVRGALGRYDGRLMDTAGDGIFAIFDASRDAVGAAVDIGDSVRALGLELRSGIHVGHCWEVDEKCAGTDVHVGARLADCAEPGEILVSEPVAERVRREGVAVVEHRRRALKGLPGSWRVYAVAPRLTRSDGRKEVGGLEC